MTKAFMLFHLNLAYSSIAVSNRKMVIDKCYYPILELIKKTKIPIGIEATSWTLKQIQMLDPNWIKELKCLLDSGQAEFVGSGYTQLIGPLVPYEVNFWNQKIGLEDYQSIFQAKPALALINEMAFSTGMIEIYQELNYQGIIMDNDNICLSLGLENGNSAALPSHAMGREEFSLPVLWSDSILFQKFQRYAHGDVRLIDYIDLFRKRALKYLRPLAIYCNDAEIFDFRPGRYQEERPVLNEGEWRRIENLLKILSDQEKVIWLSPTAALNESLRSIPLNKKILSSIKQPVPVKKQAKYNVSRWAITGRNDLWINTLCHRYANTLKNSKNRINWRSLCEFWASDLRTHIEKDRWQKNCVSMEVFSKQHGISMDYGSESRDDDLALKNNDPEIIDKYKITRDNENILLSISSAEIELVLNLRRGLTIHTLAFYTQDFQPIIGTLPHGYFDSIEFGADFYSAGVVVELPMEHRRLTDLEWVDPIIYGLNGALHIVAKINTVKGEIVKRYVLTPGKNTVSLMIELPKWERLHSIVRMGALSFLPEAFSSTVSLQTCNGGSALEEFKLDQPCDYTLPASTLVSCTTGFGATTGEIIIGDQKKKIKISWDPAEAAIFPMLQHQIVSKNTLTRLFFSLNEIDETTRSGGEFPPFKIALTPIE